MRATSDAVGPCARLAWGRRKWPLFHDHGGMRVVTYATGDTTVPIRWYGLLLAQGQTQGSMLQQRTNKTLTTSPFVNTCEVDEVSPEVESRGFAGLRCLQPSWDTDL
jgi:hypothetical protein